MRHRKGEKINGWVVVDKPKGVGSTQIVSRVKRLYNAQKAGHAGTLDPMATGVLPVALGEATKTIPFVTDGKKEYEFTVVFGAATDTDDADGSIVETCEKIPTKEEIIAVLPRFTGEISQIPPHYCAVHVDGKRAYDLARQNAEMTLQARQITVHSLEMTAFEGNTASFKVACSKGTYVRSLGRDIALATGGLGHVSVLRRVKCGKFLIKDTILLEKYESFGHSKDVSLPLISIETMLDDIPACALTEKEAALLSNGGFLNAKELVSRTPALADVCESDVFCALYDNRLVALVRVEDGFVRPVRVIL